MRHKKEEAPLREEAHGALNQLLADDKGGYGGFTVGEKVLVWKKRGWGEDVREGFEPVTVLGIEGPNALIWWDDEDSSAKKEEVQHPTASDALYVCARARVSTLTC